MYDPTAAYMKPLNSGTASMRSTPSASYIHEPTPVLNSSMTASPTLIEPSGHRRHALTVRTLGKR